MEEVLKIVQDETLTYHQQLLALARLAENFDHTIKLSDELVKAKEEGIICDLGEGNLPYHIAHLCAKSSLVNSGLSKIYQ